MKHLTAANYKVMPWANGRGQTVEMCRVDRDGALLWRLSRASVVADGAFSVLPGIARNLTVISGSGFDLVGDGVALRCDLLVPVAFDGGVAVTAAGVVTPSDDFNVMTARGVPLPAVLVVRGETVMTAGGTLCVYALEPVRVNGVDVVEQDLITTQGGVAVTGQAIVVRMFV